MDWWCVWSCVLESLPIVEMCRMRRVCRDIKSKCDEIAGRISIRSASYSNTFLAAIKSRAYSEMPLCGDPGVCSAVSDYMERTVSTYFMRSMYNIGASGNVLSTMEAVHRCADYMGGKVVEEIISGFVSMERFVTDKRLLDLICTMGRKKHVFINADPMWQMAIYMSDTNRKWMYDRKMWKSESILRMWPGIAQEFKARNKLHHLAVVLMEGDRTKELQEVLIMPEFNITNLLDGKAIRGSRWMDTMIDCPYIDPSLLVVLIMNRKTIDEDMPAIVRCLARGATLSFPLVIRANNRALFEAYLTSMRDRQHEIPMDTYRFLMNHWQTEIIKARFPRYGRLLASLKFVDEIRSHINGTK